MNRMKVLLMYVSALDIPARVDPKTGEMHDALAGVSMEYFFFGEHGEQLEPKISADGTSGIRRGKVFIRDPKVINRISYIPGIYDGEFELKVGADGKPMLNLVDVDFVAKASITEMTDSLQGASAAGTEGSQPEASGGKGKGK